MELAAESGGAVAIDSGSTAVCGRSLRLSSGSVPYAADLTVSRRHLSLRFLDEDEPRIFFEVVGRNPICILSNGIGEKRLYKNGEKGELKSGDKLSLSIEKPFFFTVGKLRQAEDNADVDDHEDVVSGLETELDVGRIDPVKEFGFLPKGHEFDHYPTNKIRAVKEWNWFLDEPSEATDEEEVDDKTVKRKRGGRKKNRSTGEGEEEWTGESEEEKVTVFSSRGAKKQYANRSRDVKKPSRDSSSKHKKIMEHDFDEEDDSDETIGGFIVNDEGEEELDEEEDEEEDEDEYDDDE